MADKVKRTPAKLSKLVEDFDMEIVCRGSDYDQRTVSISDMNRPALQLVGFYDYFEPKRLQVFGKSEMTFLKAMKLEDRRRVFDNLLRNAVNYSTPGGLVELRAEEADGRVEITVRNEGLEIPEGELANIFQKFYRLDAARSSRTGGAGLGLAIAKEIVESHGGNIRCESNGRLTSFVISLPLYKEVRHVFKRNRAGLSEPK